MRMTITLGDTMIFMVLLFLTGGSFFLLHAFESPGALVIIEMKGNVVYRGSIAEDRKITLNAAYGNVRIQIKDKKVGVVYSECPEKICIRGGWRSYIGESVFCAPNEVIIRILGADGIPAPASDI